MIGVVLWCNVADRQAVILCEDHGHFAFFHDNQGGLDCLFEFDVGDLVSFRLYPHATRRLACNVVLCAP